MPTQSSKANDNDDDRLDEVLLALANPHRRDIVYLVGLQPWAVNQLATHRGLSLPAIHKHITILVDAGLVTRHKRGRTTYLTLGHQPLKRLQEWVGQFHTYWGSDQATYENYARHLGIDLAERTITDATDTAAGPNQPTTSRSRP